MNLCPTAVSPNWAEWVLTNAIIRYCSLLPVPWGDWRRSTAKALFILVLRAGPYFGRGTSYIIVSADPNGSVELWLAIWLLVMWWTFLLTSWGRLNMIRQVCGLSVDTLMLVHTHQHYSALYALMLHFSFSDRCSSIGLRKQWLLFSNSFNGGALLMAGPFKLSPRIEISPT